MKLATSIVVVVPSFSCFIFYVSVAFRSLSATVVVIEPIVKPALLCLRLPFGKRLQVGIQGSLHSFVRHKGTEEIIICLACLDKAI